MNFPLMINFGFALNLGQGSGNRRPDLELAESISYLITQVIYESVCLWWSDYGLYLNLSQIFPASIRK